MRALFLFQNLEQIIFIILFIKQRYVLNIHNSHKQIVILPNAIALSINHIVEFWFILLSATFDVKVWIYKGVIRNKSKKDRQHTGQKKIAKGQTTIYKTLHRKLKIYQHEPY